MACIPNTLKKCDPLSSFLTFGIPHIVDTTPPVISGCPENQTEIIPFQAQVGQVTWPEPSATDQSGVPMLSSRTHEPGSSFSIGSTKVEYIFTDDSANQANCIFFVLVEEGEDLLFILIWTQRKNFEDWGRLYVCLHVH